MKIFTFFMKIVSFLMKIFTFLFHDNVSDIEKYVNYVKIVGKLWDFCVKLTLTVMFRMSIISDTPKIPQFFPVDTTNKRQNK